LQDHFHLIVKPDDEIANISEIMRSLKSNFSRDVNQLIKGDVPERRLLGKQYSSRFAKDFDIIDLSKYKNKLKILHFKWQKSFHHHVIMNLKDFENHHNYTVNNFYKHNLPENWKYVSTNY